jgi:hypothetical protein
MKLVATVAALAIASSAPVTTIVSGPQGSVTANDAQFEFSSDQAASFECSLDGAPFSPCTSPFSASGLAVGDHSFSVRGIDANGEAEQAPPVRQWTIVPPPNALPVVKLTTPVKRRLAVKQLRRLAGTAVSPARVTRVQVALTFGPPNKDYFPPQCWYVDMRTGALVRQLCVLPRYTTVAGTTNWSYAVPRRVAKRIPAGRYELIVRAFNEYNQAIQKHFKVVFH